MTARPCWIVQRTAGTGHRLVHFCAVERRGSLSNCRLTPCCARSGHSSFRRPSISLAQAEEEGALALRDRVVVLRRILRGLQPLDTPVSMLDQVSKKDSGEHDPITRRSPRYGSPPLAPGANPLPPRCARASQRKGGPPRRPPARRRKRALRASDESALCDAWTGEREGGTVSGGLNPASGSSHRAQSGRFKPRRRAVVAGFTRSEKKML